MDSRLNENDVAAWLNRLGLGQYAEVFDANDVDFRALTYLNDDDLKELGGSLGHRRSMYAAIEVLKEEKGAPGASNEWQR